MTKWVGHDELSLEKEKGKRVMIYYAYPEGTKYGYFSSTLKSVRDTYLKDRNND
jgi:hypothetical protein